MCISADLLYDFEQGKPAYCLGSFVAKAGMNFPSISVLLENIQAAYRIGGMEIFAPRQNLS